MAKKTEKKSESKQEMPFPSREAALEALEKSTLSDAEKARLSDPLAPVADAVARLDDSAKPGRSEGEEALFRAAEDQQSAVNHLRRIARPGESLVQAVERMEALARATSAPAVGVIVQETAPSQYKVHVLESDADGVRVWDTEPKESLPWHAARVLVDRVVETKLTPEDKR